MISFVNAKINLGLNIVGRRRDGYHLLESLFYPVGKYNGTPENPEPFGDVLEINLQSDGSEDLFRLSGNPIDCALEKNLVFRAVNLFRAEALKKGYVFPGVDLTLDKHLPDGAGLGGGSADASFVLLTLNRLSSGLFTGNELLSMAASLGADCPFFINNEPALVSGIGEMLEPFPLDLSGHWAVLLKPLFSISTKEAFSGIVPREPEVPIESIVRLPVEEWRRSGLKNDFEDSIFPLHPEMQRFKDMLYASGALYASMSGSGSALYGIYSDRHKALYGIRSVAVLPGISCFLVKL